MSFVLIIWRLFNCYRFKVMANTTVDEIRAVLSIYIHRVSKIATLCFLNKAVKSEPT